MYQVNQTLMLVGYRKPESSEVELVICNPTGQQQFEADYGHNYEMPGYVMPESEIPTAIRRKMEIGSGWRTGRMPSRKGIPCREWNFLRAIMA